MKSYKHGTYTAYARHGCRCDRCRAYQNERVARNRAERLAEGRISHGTQSGWDAGCRCDSCASVHRLRGRRDWAAKRYREGKSYLPRAVTS